MSFTSPKCRFMKFLLIAGGFLLLYDTVTVNGSDTDTESPVLSCPVDIVEVTDTGQPDTHVTWTSPTVTDNSGEGLTPVSEVPPGRFPIGTTTVTYSATDSAGNTGSCSFNVTIKDTESPVLSCPVDIERETEAGQPDTDVTWTSPTVTDNSGEVLTPVSEITPGRFPIGTTTVTYTATDNAGNTGSCSFNVTIKDTESPVLSCPVDIERETETGQPDTHVTWTLPTVTDNSGEVLTPVSEVTPGRFPIGTSKVTYSATDDAGNTGSCSFNVTVIGKFALLYKYASNRVLMKEETKEGNDVNYVLLPKNKIIEGTN
ncbi:hyalin-like [Ptychodera flava]|uniref:hyalin-like n=1 Tax=Ptychodera flava TaxID=63121 RepID=UPI00396A37F4